MGGKLTRVVGDTGVPRDGLEGDDMNLRVTAFGRGKGGPALTKRRDGRAREKECAHTHMHDESRSLG